MNKYFFGYDENEKYFWHWYAILVQKLTGRIKFHNLPDTIDETYLKRRLLLDGRIAFFNDNGLTAYEYGNIAPFDKYGRSTLINVTYRYGNPQQKHEYNSDEFVLVFSKPDVSINKGVGFVSEVCRTASILATIDMTLKITLENDRLIAIADTISDSDINGVNQLFDKMRQGERVIAAKSSIIDNIRVNPLANKTTRNITDYTMLTTYYMAEFYNNIGISAMTTSKRERMVTDEITANQEIVDYSFKQTVDLIKRGINEVNERFNTNITVEYVAVDDDADKTEADETDETPEADNNDKTVSNDDGQGE